MQKSYFLNYKNPKHFYRLMSGAIKSTDGINTEDATFMIQAENAVSWKYQKSELTVLAVLRKTYLDVSSFKLLYNNGKTQFPMLSVAPFLEEGSVLKRVTLEFKKLCSPEDSYDSDLSSLFQRHSILFEKEFESPIPNTVLNFQSIGFRTPFFTAPVKGESLPLWCMGGKNALLSNLDQIESLFVYPVQNSEHPEEASLRIVRLSEILKRDASFIKGTSSRFVGFPQNACHWNLTQEIERGAIELLNPNTSAFRSVHIEPRGNSEDEVLIRFIKEI